MNRQQAYRTPPWKKQMQTLIRVGTGLIILFVIALVYLNYSARLSEVRLKIQQAHADRNTLMRQIAEYQTRRGALTSFESMRRRAEQSGYADIDFYDDSQFVYLPLDGYDPNAELIRADRFAPSAPPVSLLRPEYTISLQTYLRERLLESPNNAWGLP